MRQHTSAYVSISQQERRKKRRQERRTKGRQESGPPQAPQALYFRTAPQAQGATLAHSAAAACFRQHHSMSTHYYQYEHTLVAVVMDLGDEGTASRPLMKVRLQLLRRQQLYICTSKASKLSFTNLLGHWNNRSACSGTRGPTKSGGEAAEEAGGT